MNPITVLYFGELMSKLGIGREQLRLPPSAKDVASLMKLLTSRGGEWHTAFDKPRATLRVTINKRDAEFSSELKAGDELAFIESVSL